MSDTSGFIAGARLAPITVDGKPLNSLASALQANQQRVAGQRHKDLFWSSPRRPLGDTTVDIFEVRFNQPHRINNLSFEVARFPCRVEVQWLDPVTGLWLPVQSPEGHPIILDHVDSHPALVADQVQKQSHVHPYHRGNGHWQKYDLDVRSMSTNRIRLRFTRPAGIAPVDRFGTALPYPVGVRKFGATFRVTKRRDLPTLPPHPLYPTWQQPIDSTSDILGSAQTFSLRQNLARDLLRNGIWKSEPQPVSHALVNFYVDIRDGRGGAQVADRLYLDPLYAGTSVSLYYSNEDAPTSFKAVNNPQGIVFGHVGADLTGLLFANGPCFVDVSNEKVHFDPSQPWWLGLRFMPQYDSDDTNTYALFDFERVSLTVTQGTYTLTFDQATTTVATTFTANLMQTILIAYDGAGAITLSVIKNSNSIQSGTVTLANPSDEIPELLRFLGTQTSNTYAANARLLNVMLKYGPLADVDLAAFTADQMTVDAYCNPPEYPTEDGASTDNSLLRMTFQQIVTGANPTGFIGGPGSIYSGLSWTPVNRTFTAAKGNLDFPPIKAKYLNLEFTNLSSQSYENYQPIYRDVQLATSLHEPVITNRYTPEIGGLKTNQDIAKYQLFAYGDFLHLSPPSLPVPAAGFTRTEVAFTKDPVALPKLRRLDPLYGLQSWRPPHHAPRQVSVGPRQYVLTNVQHDTRVGFFCGLRALKVYRVSYLMDDDTRQYEELFHDQAHLATVNNLIFDANNVHTPMSFPVGNAGSMTSKVFTSRRQVIGLQFATTQSPPTQLLTDPDFNTFNPDATQNLDQWEPVGDAIVSPSNKYNTDIGTTVEVQRTRYGRPIVYGQSPQAQTPGPIGSTGTTPFDPLDYTWGAFEIRFGTWVGIDGQTPALTYSALEGILPPSTTVSTGTPPSGGIIADPGLGGIKTRFFATPSRAGRLYAAARVIAPKALQVPLWVQVISDQIDPVTNDFTVLAEQPYNVSAGTVCEWYVGYTIGEGNVNSANQIGVRVVQKYLTHDEWNVDNISLFEDSLVWEFSNDGGQNFYRVFDIRNDPRGVFIFPPTPALNPEPSMGRSLVWRVTAYRPDLHVNALVVRPWYDTFSGPVPPREIAHRSGPQTTDYDHYPPVDLDPHWRTWFKPVPIEWWFFYKQWLLLSAPVMLSVPTSVLLVDSLVIGV